MNFKSWDDFLEAKEGTKEMPPQGKGSTSYFAPNAQDSGKPKVRVSDKSGKGLADEASPSVKDPNTVINAGKKPDYSILTTEKFVQDTGKLTSEQFVASMYKEAKKNEDGEKGGEMPAMTCQYTGKQVFPAAIDVAKFLAHAMPHNERARKTFMRELKSSEGGLSALMNEALGHSEVYDEIVNQMGQPEANVPKKLVKSMNDNHMKFMTEMGFLMAPKNESVDAPMKKRLGIDDDEAGEDEPEMGDLHGGGDEDGDEGAPDMDGGMGSVPTDGADGQMSPDSPELKLNKEFAYHHMIKEMAKHEPMLGAMKDTCAMCGK